MTVGRLGSAEKGKMELARSVRMQAVQISTMDAVNWCSLSQLKLHPHAAAEMLFCSTFDTRYPSYNTRILHKTI